MKYHPLLFNSITAFTILSLLIFSGCNNHAQPTTEQKYNGYLSFTTTEESPMTDFYLAEGIVHKIDLKSKEVSEVFQYHHTAMYPLGVYDEQTNCVYYSKELSDISSAKEGLNDQIFVHDFTTNTDTMLTDDLIAVNDMIPIDENTVFFLGARRDGLLALGKVNPKTKEVQYWKEPAPLTTRAICVDRAQKRVYAAVFDDDEEYASLRTNGPAPSYTLCSYDYDLSDCREILRVENKEIYGVCSLNGKVFYTTLEWEHENPIFSNQLIDVDTGEVLWEAAQHFSRGRCFSEDGKGIYCFLDGENETDEKSGAQASGIYYFDFETQEYTPVFTKEGVNWSLQPNFQLMPSGVKQ